ncbi:MAG: FlgD immunoglobulin-like domain containing protein [Candidatus Margulisiibacteriota bacterium]
MKKVALLLLSLLFSANLAIAEPGFISPVIGNIDDSTAADEVITSTFDGRLYAWREERTLAAGAWPVQFNGVICAAPVLADLDSNPKDQELLVPIHTFNNAYKIVALQGNGAELWAKELDFELNSSPAIGQINKEKIVFLGSRDGKLYAYKLKNWQKVDGWPRVVAAGVGVAPVCADLNNDGNDEVVVSAADGTIVTLILSGKEWTATQLSVKNSFAEAGAIADLDNDGKKELVLSGNNLLYLWSYKNGAWESRWSLPVNGQPARPIIVDLDNDREIVCYTGKGKLQIVNNQGSVVNTTLGPVKASAPGQKADLFLRRFLYSYDGSGVAAVNKGSTVTEWGLYHHYKQPFIMSLFATPDPFSPNGDGRKDTTAVTTQIGSPQECDLKLEIVDGQNKVVKKIKESHYKPTAKESYVWDGKGDKAYNNEGVVPSADYNLSLRLESDFSDQLSQLSRVTVDNIPPVVSNVTVTKKVITDDPSARETTISYRLSEPASVKISFVDEQGKGYRTFTDQIDLGTGTYTWDGKGDANQLFSGKYYCLITAEDLAGNLGSAEVGKITVDVDPPLINGVYAEPKVFSTTSKIRSTLFHYAVSDDSKVSASVYSSTGKLVASLLKKETKVKGAYSIKWSGLADDEKALPDGNYNFKINALDETGHQSNTIETVVEIDSTPPSLLQGFVSPTEFSPKALAGNSTLSFLISEKGTITVVIADPTGRTIRTLADKEKIEAGINSFVWDGRDSGGTPVNDGLYSYRITAEDLAGNQVQASINVKAKSTPPDISNLTGRPLLLTPNSDGTNDVGHISLTLATGVGETKLGVRVLNSAGATIKTLVNDEPYYDGNYPFDWFGDVDVKGGLADKDGNGIADDGRYSYQIIALDSLGVKVEKQADVVVVSERPVFALAAGAEKFSPNGDNSNDFLTFNYSIDYNTEFLTAPANLKLEIKDSTNLLVYTKYFTQTVGRYSYDWDGKENDGSSLPEGKYVAYLSGYDAAGNYTLAPAVIVEIDNSSALINLFNASPNPFSPAINGVKDTTSVAYSFSKPSRVKIMINDSNGLLVKTITTESFINREVIGSFLWDGRNNDGVVVVDGPYTYQIESTDAAGNSSIAKGEVVVDDAIPGVPIANEVVSSTNQVELTYAGSAENGGYLEVYDNDILAAGTMSTGNFSAPLKLMLGMNKIKSRVTDAAGNISSFSSEQSVNYEVDPPVISSVAVTPAIAMVGPIAVTFKCSEPLKEMPSVMINGRAATFNGENGNVYNYQYAVQAGDPQGAAQVLIQATDLAGNVGTSGAVSLVVDTVPPVISLNGRGANPNPFTPNLKKTTTFDFSAVDATTAVRVDYIKISNVAGQTVKTLGEGVLVWDGKVDGGISDINGDGLADEGTYTFEIHAVDAAGNTFSQTGKILVNRIVLHLAEPAAPTKQVNPTPFSPIVLPETSISFALNQETSGPAWLGVLSIMKKKIKTMSIEPIGTVKIEIKTTGGALVKTLLPSPTDDGQRAAGSYQLGWDGKDNNDSIVASGSYKVVIAAVDLVGNPAENLASLTYDLVIDTTPPTGSLTINGNNAYSTSLGVTLNLSASDSYSNIVKMRISNDGVFDSEPEENYSTTKSWSLVSGGDGARTVYAKYMDAAGNWSPIYNDSIIFDETPPAVSIQSVSATPFNQMYQTTTIGYTINDLGDVYYEAGIYTAAGSLIKTIRRYSDGVTAVGAVAYTWDGRNDSGDYVNEGVYKFKVRAKDQAGNESGWQETAINAVDDILVSGSIVSSTSPNLSVSENTVSLSWLRDPPDDSNKLGPVRAFIETSSAYFGGATDDYNRSDDFSVDHGQNVELYLRADGAVHEGRRSFEIYRTSDNSRVWGMNDHSEAYAGETLFVWLDSGTYYLRVRAGVAGGGNTAKTEMKIWFIDRKYNQYARDSADFGCNWSAIAGPIQVDSYPSGQDCLFDPEPTFAIQGMTPVFTYASGTKVYHLYRSSNNLYYRKGVLTAEYKSYYSPALPSGFQSIVWSTSAQITHSNTVSTTVVSLCRKVNDLFVAWKDNRDNNSIYFQKIPSNFAPTNGTATVLSVNKTTKPIVKVQSATLESPSLIAPAKDRQDVQNIRPAFEWQHHKADTTEYRVEVAKNDSFTIDHQIFSKTAGTGAQDKADSNLYYFNYSIHEFDPSLERNTDYFWKVTALSPTNAATSETWGFRIQPELTLVGVTNYPNPFNPNREQTKIRYRLSADADEVRIRIYDITGSLVTELDGTTNGEGMSVWQKYNDVSWDGRNGRGNLVVNGIYPFEIMARIGDKTISGRGKIAVLK